MIPNNSFLLLSRATQQERSNDCDNITFHQHLHTVLNMLMRNVGTFQLLITRFLKGYFLRMHTKYSTILEQTVKQEAAETSSLAATRDADQLPDMDPSMEDCRGSQENFIVSIKNEPIEDDTPEMKYSNGDTIHSIISVKDEVLDIECEEQQINEPKVKAHRIINDKNKPYECPHCPRTFSTYTIMYRHKGIHEGIKREDCDICGKSISKRHLKQHKLIHSNEKTHKCDMCDKSFLRIEHLRSHIRKHTGEKPYQCEYCESSFAVSSHRRTHMRLHLGDNVHRCDLCPLAFPQAAKLRVHLTTHKNEGPEVRERNMKALKEAEVKLQLKVSQKFDAKLKKKKHDEDMRYECPYCPLQFKSNSTMHRHKAIHKGVKRVACDICGKIVRKTGLNEHKLTHNDEKAHQCDICEKRFVQMSQLRRHMVQHTGEKKYKCKYCDRSFTQCGDRMKHMRIHVGDNVHRCELCPSAFRLAKELRAHLTEHKNEDSETRDRNMKALGEAEAKLHLKSSKNETQQPSKEESQQ